VKRYGQRRRWKVRMNLRAEGEEEVEGKEEAEVGVSSVVLAALIKKP
jgi:hypothetical protein